MGSLAVDPSLPVEGKLFNCPTPEREYRYSDPKQLVRSRSSPELLLHCRGRGVPLGRPTSPSVFCADKDALLPNSSAQREANAEQNFLDEEEFKKYAIRQCLFVMSSFQNSLEYFHEFITLLTKAKREFYQRYPKGQVPEVTDPYRAEMARLAIFLRQCESLYKQVARQKGYDDELDPDLFSFSRKFRRKWFPPSNALRLLLVVRIPNLIKDCSVLFGTPLSQELFVQLHAFFSWTPFLGWLYYLPRIGINIGVSIRNALRSRSVREAPRHKKVSRFFKAFFFNTSERIWEYVNDLMWMVVGLITCFCPPAAVLTPVLYLYDIGVEIARGARKVRTWAQQLRYVHASLTFDPYREADVESVHDRSFIHWQIEGSINLNRVKRSGGFIADEAAESYVNKTFLKDLYQEIASTLLIACKQVENNRYFDVSLCTLKELHKRSYNAWAFHVSMVRNRLASEEMKNGVDACLAYFNKRQFLLARMITHQMKRLLFLRSPDQARPLPDTGYRATIFRHMSRKLRGFKYGRFSVFKNVTCASLLAAGMIMAYAGSGNAMFGLATLTMPTLPALSTAGIAIVVLTCLSQIILSRIPMKSEENTQETNRSLKGGA